ncbi:hypothetical protein CGL56_04790 [Neolewinella marina]|uniref:Uncharacterized protein n=2 Tax=Neolewinella marina TaxID=438751 RepID=A0A2G0CK53_9BACT|nr:hypothetical protein CGL56_04790 [Neolewinella marina]
MVSAQPGTYFRSELVPPPQMVYGMLENALGWHLPHQTRKEVMQGLTKLAKKQFGKVQIWKGHPWLSGKESKSAKSGYFSLLQYHLSLEKALVPEDLMTYDDLWSMHLRDRGMNFVGGSRRYDFRLEGLITKLRSTAKEKGPDKQEVGDRKEFVRIELEDLYETEEQKIHSSSLGDAFPMYYVSPKTRGFVVTRTPYRIPVRATPTVWRMLETLDSLAMAPTYLGTSEGWVATKISSDV